MTIKSLVRNMKERFKNRGGIMSTGKKMEEITWKVKIDNVLITVFFCNKLSSDIYSCIVNLKMFLKQRSYFNKVSFSFKFYISSGADKTGQNYGGFCHPGQWMPTLFKNAIL